MKEDMKKFEKTQNMGQPVEGLIFETEFRKAQTIIKNIFNYSKNSSVAHRLQGFSYLAQDKKEEAIESFNKAIKIHPTYALVYLQLAMVYAKDQNTEMTLKNLIQCRQNGIEHYANNYETQMIHYAEFEFIQNDEGFKALTDPYPKDEALRDIYKAFKDDRINYVIKQGQKLLATHSDPMAVAQIMMVTTKSIISDLREHGDDNLDLYTLKSLDEYKALKKELKNKINELEDNDYSNETFESFRSCLYN